MAMAHLRRIRGPQAASFWTGNLKQFFTRDGADFQWHVAHDFGTVVKLNGSFGEPMLYVADPKALHTILIKDEPIFPERPDFFAINRLMFGRHALVSTMGAQHGRQRKLLNPVFSVNHMRHMLPLFYSIAHQASSSLHSGSLRSAIASRVGEEGSEVDVLGWMARTALELIGQGGLGCSLDPLVSDSTDAYGQAMKSLVPTLYKLHLYRPLLLATQDTVPARLRRAFVDLYPRGTAVHELKEIIDTMDSRAREIYEAKKAAFTKGDAEVVKQVAEGKDIMSILMRANSTADAADRLSEEEVVSQMSIFLFAAMDTTSNALSRILHMLALHPDVQEKLRQELLGAGAAGGMEYDELNRLPFLDCICRETLRVYPPVPTMMRVASKDTILPLSEPIYTIDGTRMDEIPIVKGTQLVVGAIGCNTSRTLWGEDAHEWKPERWLSVPQAVADARIPGVYSNILTFLGGKRACIGFKFSEMEMKVVLSVLVSTFTFELPETPIAWNVGGVWYPTAGKDSPKPEMPLKVGLYKRSQA
ncbi:cytochrome P450 [Daedalea quercina L-15889]|uniref:Cytochrome P450 n=1 Tax=Daedalea quercina L-15889 TaxID=1314783 RepID=A0A165TT32_9APHY|nr:cytochrome P450 [Daedalea quercina L-15889]